MRQVYTRIRQLIKKIPATAERFLFYAVATAERVFFNGSATETQNPNLMLAWKGLIVTITN